MTGGQYNTIVFDLGNVLIPWNPRNLYRKLFPNDDSGMEWFLANICTSDWSNSLDAETTFAQGIARLISAFPEHANLIRAYDERWEEMLGGQITENVSLLQELSGNKWPLYALSNWPTEKIQIARKRFTFFHLFRDMVISGEVGVRKPDPAIFRLLIERNHLEPSRTVFIDDTVAHCETARSFGITAILYNNPVQLRSELGNLGIH